MHLFSERHKEDIQNGQIALDIPANVRLKIVDCMKRYNSWDGVAMEDSLFFGKLKEVILMNEEIFPKFYIEDTMKKSGVMDQFMMDVKVEYMFDALEIYGRMINPFRRDLFREECNHILRTGNLPFKFNEGYLTLAEAATCDEGLECGIFSLSPIKRVLRFFS